MIRLFYSNRTERLAEALIQNLRPEGASPLDPVPIVIPSLALAAHLKHQIAAETGIAANLDLIFLERFLGGLVEASGGPKVSNFERMQAALLRALHDEQLLATDPMAPVREYLFAGGEDEPAIDLRRFQLAHRVARHFDEYVLTREQMLEAWRERTVFGSTLHARTEAWQRALWLWLIEHDCLVTLVDAFGAPRLELEVPPRVHLFDVQLAAPAYRTILGKLGERSELLLYALNPCHEFWEDMQAGFDFDERGDDTPALRLWGRPGRESVRLLDALANFDFEACFEAPAAGGRTLLTQFQQDVLDRHPERTTCDPSFDFEDDESVRLLACPGLRREVEVIAQEIWSMVERYATTDRPLAFNEIAVVLAGRDQEAYRAHVGAVFEEFYQIPHGFLEVPLSSQSRVVEAILLLLALPHSRFTRPELLRFITHPAVIAKVGDADPEDWLTWCDDLGIVHGADRSDHENTYIERDLYNWEQGLKRLMLGTFMSGQRSADERVFSAGGQDYLPYEVPVDRLRSAAKLASLVRSLIADARFAERTQLTLAEWAELLRGMITAYVGAEEEHDERDLFRCLSAVDELAELDPEGPPISFRIAAEFVKQRLSRLATNVGTPLAEGVVVAPLTLAYALPFRVIFLMGMGEGRFPVSDKKSQLDLRALEHRPGDFSPRERDQYRFLLALSSARDAVRISWVSRDPQTGEDMMPSPVLLELEQMLERGYLREEGRLERRHPLRRYHDRVDGTAVPPIVAREVQALELRDSLRRHLGDPEAALSLRALRHRLPAPTWARIAERLRLSEPPPITDDRSVITVRYEALRRFLEDPLQGWARFVLELRDEEQIDPFAREDELFSTGVLSGTIELRRVLIEKFRLDAENDLAVPLETLYDARADRLELEGRLPTGVFGRAERAKHKRILLAWQKQVRDALNGRAQRIDPVRFGRAQERSALVETADPIRIEVDVGGRTATVEIHGQTQALLRETPGSVTLTMGSPRGSRTRLFELRGFVDQVMLSASGRSAEVPFRSVVAFGEDTPWVTEFAPFSRAEAQAYLQSLLADLLSETHAYLLPFGTVLQLEKAGREGRLGPAQLQRILANARHDDYGPLLDPKVDPPPVEDIDRILKTRFGPYFEKRRGGW